MRGSAPDARDGDGSDFRSPDHKERLLPGRYVTTLLLRGNTRPRKFGETGAWISLTHEWRTRERTVDKKSSPDLAQNDFQRQKTAVSSNRLFQNAAGRGAYIEAKDGLGPRVVPRDGHVPLLGALAGVRHGELNVQPAQPQDDEISHPFDEF